MAERCRYYKYQKFLPYMCQIDVYTYFIRTTPTVNPFQLHRLQSSDVETIFLKLVSVTWSMGYLKSRRDNPQKLTQLSPRSHPRHLIGKRTVQKDAIKDITSDGQMNSYIPYRWSPASLTINIYFYLVLYSYITRVTINNGTPHLKSLKNKNRRAALGRLAINLLWASTSLRSTNSRL